jgi:hypothetical protein
MFPTTSETIEALHAVINEAAVAQNEMVAALDQMVSLPRHKHPQAEGDAMYRVETALSKLCVRLARIITQAGHGGSAFDPNEISDHRL